MPGAGTFPAGLGPGGFSPQDAPVPGQVKLSPRAVNYNPRTKDFTTTVPAGGGLALYDAIHPVDQAVELALFVPLGQLKSAPTVGHTFREVQRLSGVTLQNAVEDRTRLALKRITDKQQIKILAIQVDVQTRGQLKIAITYFNLMTAQIVKKTVQPNFAQAT
jgi:hypothetical protein